MIIIALVQPMIIIYYYGFSLPSISSIWLTNLQPLFIITNACTSYFLFGINKWGLSGFLLLLLTSISVEFSLFAHNIIAGLFFLSCMYPMFSIKRLRYYLVLYISSLIIWLLFGMFAGEIFGVFIICLYHVNLLTITSKIIDKHH